MPDIAESFEKGAWEFTPAVVEVFDEHVRQSVPHYDLIQALVADCSDWLLPAGGIYADLGCSTGTTAQLVLGRHPERMAAAYLYDEAEDMVTAAEEKLSQAYPDQITAMTYHLGDDPLNHTGADLTTALFALQFMPHADRLQVLRAARASSKPGGALLVAEKVLDGP